MILNALPSNIVEQGGYYLLVLYLLVERTTVNMRLTQTMREISTIIKERLPRVN